MVDTDVNSIFSIICVSSDVYAEYTQLYSLLVLCFTMVRSTPTPRSLVVAVEQGHDAGALFGEVALEVFYDTLQEFARGVCRGDNACCYVAAVLRALRRRRTESVEERAVPTQCGGCPQGVAQWGSHWLGSAGDDGRLRDVLHLPTQRGTPVGAAALAGG